MAACGSPLNNLETLKFACGGCQTEAHMLSFLYLFLCVCDCMHACMYEEDVRLAGAGVVVTVSHLICVLGTELMSSARTARAINS